MPACSAMPLTPNAPSVREAIGRDPLLTAEQKQALLNVYESFIK